MANKNLKNELYQLMANSKAIASLDEQKKLQMQDKILALSDQKILTVVEILKREQRDLGTFQKKFEVQNRELKKLMKMAQALNAACKRLEKIFLQTRESAESNESSIITDSLLDQIDRL